MELSKLKIPTNKIKQLKGQEIETVEDLIRFFPKDYYDFSAPIKINSIQGEGTVSVVGKVLNVVQRPKVTYVKITDGTDFLYVYFFNQKHIAKVIDLYKIYIFCGNVKVEPNMGNQKQMIPIFFNEDINKGKRIFPIYKKIKGMSEQYLIDLITQGLKLMKDEDFLLDANEKLFAKFNLIKEYDALTKIHNPKTWEDVRQAKKRFIFDDLFVFNFQLKKLQRDNNSKTKYKTANCKYWKNLYDSLGFDLTLDQKKCLKYLYALSKNSKKINALVQADVGAGKTIIAIFLMLLAAENGFQSCLMAPTEILAKQHYLEISDRLKNTPFNICFLSSSLKKKEKKKIIKDITEGEYHLVVGTHSVIQENVEFKDLGLIVVDEQHRFGVAQREALTDKSEDNPHVIVMSATPIPRTLSMAMYGDNIQVLNIKTKPAGRKPVKTMQVNDDNKAFSFMLNEINKGHQAYVVCPLIEDSDYEKMADIESVTTVYNNMKYYFKNYLNVKIGLINGNMKQEEIDAEIDKFSKKQYDIIISTTIVEVGVNVPNATVMLIKNAERFGLAQLHQLRGRVGRSSIQSYCLLQSPKENDPKLEIMCSTNDGFEVAKQDLIRRGPGELLGTKQHGNNRYIMLMMYYNKVYQIISKITDYIYENKDEYNKFKKINQKNLK